MRFAASYIAFLVVFGICDAIWLGTMTSRLYRPALGELIFFRPVPAALFYFGFGLGVVHFAVMPALRNGVSSEALINGALLGMLTYATYDLTNYATLRPWTLTITVADIVYGTVAVGICSWISYEIVRRGIGWGWL